MAKHHTPNKSTGPKYKDTTPNLLESTKDYLKNKYLQTALFLVLLGVGGTVVYTTIKDKDKDTIELVKDTNGYPFEQHHLAFWDDNPQFFASNLPLKRDTLAPGVNIIRDAGLVFYIVQAEDIKTEIYYEYKEIWEKQKVSPPKGKKCGKPTYKKVKKIIKIERTKQSGDYSKMRNKLSKIPEFSYLNDNEYDRSKPGNKTKSFNVPKESVKPGMFIPIPLDHKVRKISPQDFANYCHEAFQEMKNDSCPYAQETNSLLANTTEKELISSMLAFARSETAEEHTNFVQPLGAVELHRREPAYKSFSFTYFHILMENNSNGSPGPGKKARLKLGLTEGQCYHPKNACKLFLAYWIEKKNQINQGIVAKNKDKNGNPIVPLSKLHLYKIIDFLPLTSSNLERVGTKYNGSSTYADKLRPNFEFTNRLINGKITYYNNDNLYKAGFTYTGLNSSFDHLYKFGTPKGTNSNEELKKIVVTQFNKNKASNCPTINQSNVVIKEKKTKSGTIIIPDTVYIHVSAN